MMESASDLMDYLHGHEPWFDAACVAATTAVLSLNFISFMHMSSELCSEESSIEFSFGEPWSSNHPYARNSQRNMKS